MKTIIVPEKIERALNPHLRGGPTANRAPGGPGGPGGPGRRGGPPEPPTPENLEFCPDPAAAIQSGKYQWVAFDEGGNGTIDYYALLEVAYCPNIVAPKYQYMNIFVPAGYLNVDGEGTTGVNWESKIGQYTPSTAPIIFENHCAGWRAGAAISPERSFERLKGYTSEGIVYVSCGARSRNVTTGEPGTEDFHSNGKAPVGAVDQKAGVIYLRANAGVLPGDPERIISDGGSGAGQMSTALGGTGDMPEYYPYLYELGALGVTCEGGKYASRYKDSIYGCNSRFPIADISNADLAYAWWRCFGGETGVGPHPGDPTGHEFTEFQLALQDDLAQAYVEYVNSLNLKDADGKPLTLDGLRSGSFYEAVLNNLTAALNAWLAEQDEAERKEYIAKLLAANKEDDIWVKRNEDGSCAVLSLDGLMRNYGNRGNPDDLGNVFNRNKDIPSFDTLEMTAENDAFGRPDVFAVHYCASAAKVIKENYERYSKLDGFQKEIADQFISDALDGPDAQYIADQVYLMNATQILLDNAKGEARSTAAKHWRVRSGTADEHTSYTIGFTICLAAAMAGNSADYHLVWNMNHGASEGTSTGTLVQWIKHICP